MGGFLFHDLIFGPVKSRRLGVSLGINLLPVHGKYCNFNCVYCECGWTPEDQKPDIKLPDRLSLSRQLEARLKELKGTPLEPDSLTFAGNGEPTMHPDFAGIIDDTCRLRDAYAKDAKISVLSNGSMLHKKEVFEALKKIENNIQKLDGGNETMIRRINMPRKAVKLAEYVQQLIGFNGEVIIQSLFFKGNTAGTHFDNTSETEVTDWLDLITRIRPKQVMVYTIERDTAGEGLEKVSRNKLEEIALKVRQLGIDAAIFG